MNQPVAQEARNHAIMGEGKINNYPPNSDAWKDYEKSYSDTMAMIAARTGYSVKLPS